MVEAVTLRGFVPTAAFLIGPLLGWSCVPASLVPARVQSINALKLGQMGERTVNVAASISVHNSNRSDTIVLRSVEADVTLAGIHLGNGTGGAVSIPPGSSADVELMLPVAYSAIGRPLLDALGTGSVPYSADVTATPDGIMPVVRTTLEGKVAVAKDLPVALVSHIGRDRMQIVRTDVQSLSLDGASLNLAVAVDNPFPVDVRVLAIRYQAAIGGLGVGAGGFRYEGASAQPKGAKPAGQVVSGGGRTTLPIDHKAAPPEAAALIGSLGRLIPPVKVRLRGELQIDPLAGVSKVPFDVDFALDWAAILSLVKGAGIVVPGIGTLPIPIPSPGALPGLGGILDALPGVLAPTPAPAPAPAPEGATQ